MRVNNDKQIQDVQPTAQNYNIGRNQLGKDDEQMKSIFTAYDTDKDGKINTSNAQGDNEVERFISDYQKMLNDSNVDKAKLNFFTSIYNKIMDFMKPENKNKIYEDGEEIVANGVLENSEQGCIGDCWLHSEVNALKESGAGKDAFKKAIQKNDDGSYTIYFDGVKKSYTLSPKEIQSAIDENVYSKGDLDYKLIEMGLERLYGEKALDEIDKILNDIEKFKKRGDNDVVESLSYCLEILRKVRDGEIKSIDGGAGVPPFSSDGNELAYILGVNSEQIKIDSSSAIEGALIAKAKYPNEVSINFGSYYDIEKREPFNEESPELDDGHGYSIKDVKLDENENIVQVDVINPWDNSKVISLTSEEFHSMRAPGEEITVSATKETVAELSEKEENYEADELVNKCKQPNSSWMDFTLDENFEKSKKIINQFGGLNTYITEFKNALERYTNNLETSITECTDKVKKKKMIKDKEDFENSKSRVLFVTYCDNLHFSKKDAKDLVEHPERMQQYCIKYGYKY